MSITHFTRSKRFENIDDTITSAADDFQKLMTYFNLMTVSLARLRMCIAFSTNQCQNLQYFVKGSLISFFRRRFAELCRHHLCVIRRTSTSKSVLNFENILRQRLRRIALRPECKSTLERAISISVQAIL